MPAERHLRVDATQGIVGAKLQDHSVDVIANPVRLSETPTDYRLPPPLLGEHTDEILSKRLGFKKAKLAALRKRGVI